MTPREELEELILDADSFDRAAKRTRGFAIGRWVSVEERLPEFHDDRWKGVTVGAFGNVQFGRHYIGLQVGTTHWLELNLPSGKGEA